MNKWEIMLMKGMIPAYISGGYSYHDLMRALNINTANKSPLKIAIKEELDKMIVEYKNNKMFTNDIADKLTSDLLVSDWNNLTEEQKSYYNAL